MFCTTIVHAVAVVQDGVPTIVRVGELVNVPNRPNTKPAIATAAINVIAMRMTVGRSFKR